MIEFQTPLDQLRDSDTVPDLTDYTIADLRALITAATPPKPFIQKSQIRPGSYPDNSIQLEKLRAFPSCRLSQVGALSHTSTGNYQVVTYDTEDHNTVGDDMWTSGSAITIPTTGIYLLTGRVVFAGSAVGVRALQLRINGSGGTNLDHDAEPGPTAADGGALQVSTVVSLPSSTTVELYAYQNSGGNLAYAVGTHFVHLDVQYLGQSS